MKILDCPQKVPRNSILTKLPYDIVFKKTQSSDTELVPKISMKSPQQQFESSMIVSAVVTL
jgi:hypothetical protein